MTQVTNIVTGPADATRAFDHTPAAHNPAAAVMANAARTATETDARGRKITARRLNAYAYFQLACAMGDDARNSVAMDMATIAASVCSIDGTIEGPAHSKLQAEAKIGLLDFDGLEAAAKALKTLSESFEASEVKK
jgi:hypothetical protein